METKNRNKSKPKTSPLLPLCTEDVSKTLILKKKYWISPSFRKQIVSFTHKIFNGNQ